MLLLMQVDPVTDGDAGAAEAASKPADAAVPEAVSVPAGLEEEADGVAGVSGGSSFANLTLTASRCVQRMQQVHLIWRPKAGGRVPACWQLTTSSLLSRQACADPDCVHVQHWKSRS